MPYVEGDRFVDAARLHRDQRGVPRLPVHADRQRAPAAGLPGPRRDAATWRRCCAPRRGATRAARRTTSTSSTPSRRATGDAARTLVVEHADRSKVTMRRAMADATARRAPGFVTPGRFDGQVVLVTGAAQGIGERTARRISAEGGTLVLADRADLVHDAGRRAGGDRPARPAVVADLETWEGASAVVEAAVARVRPGRRRRSTPSAARSGPSRSTTTRRSRSRPRSTGRCCRRSGRCRAVAAAHDRARRRHHRQRLVGRHPRRQPGAVRGGQGRRQRDHRVARARAGAARHPRGRHRTRRHRGARRGASRAGPAPESEQEKDWYRTIVDQTVESSLLKRYGTLDEQAAAITFLASRGGLLHHRHGAAGRRWRPRLTV